VLLDGTDVQVAIFDTSPFTLPVGDTSGIEMIDWITPTLKLDLRHPTLWGQANLPVPQHPVDEADHGLFVAGIIHAIAPASDMRLVRVLDQYGQGDLFTLCQALHDFIRGQVLLSRRGVINLSLGIFPPPDAAAQGLPKELSALETAILAAEGAGITVAAASGNQAASVLPLPAQQLPAGYDTVIGVAGSTRGRGRSCFSNPGDLAAPGGDGAAPGCTPDLTSCKGGSCDLGIVSLAATKASPGDGYVYWLGTSFAAPFASGAAALLLDQTDGKIAPDEVRARIAAGATQPNLPTSDTSLGAGIISLSQVLYPYRVSLAMVMR
jgi:subtilisin family serine protease